MIDSGAALAPCAVMAASSPMPARPGAVTASSNAPVAAPSFPTKLVSFGISEDCWRWRSVALANWQRAKAKRGAEAMRNRRARLKASAAPAVPTTSEPAEADPETKAKAAKLLKLREAAKEKAKYEHEWQDRMAAAESMNT
jgi:hypothetical protein